MARKGVAPKGKSRSAGTAPTRHRQLVFGDSRRALVFQPSAQRKPAMRTAADFNLYYAAPDPWHCPSSDDLRLVRRFEKGGSGSSGLKFKRPAAGAASGGLRWLHA